MLIRVPQQTLLTKKNSREKEEEGKQFSVLG